MGKGDIRHLLNEFIEDYGIILVLIFLIVLFSLLTIQQEELTGDAAAIELAETIDSGEGEKNVMIITSASQEGIQLSESLNEILEGNGHNVVSVVNGDPAQAGFALRRLDSAFQSIDFIACTGNISNWSLIANVHERFGATSNVSVIHPSSSKFPSFLKRDNIRNVADRISVIAILAIGMTMVIITAGIDLSVGSLIALAAVTSALFIREIGGDASAGTGMLIFCSILAILLCGLLGFFSGKLSTTFKITPFIATLAMMMIARGLAYKFSNVTTIPISNEAFAWLGKGRMGGIPVSVIVMILLYIWAYFVMHWTTFGRRIYAIGGNAEAARLSGVPVNSILVKVYTICGLLAGLGGVITASNLAGGAATYGDYYELYTIAAVVVGGTSLMGGQGKIIGTLIGAFIIAVIQSGMNQVGIESNTQKIVFGIVIIGAIIIDKYKRKEITTVQLVMLIAAILAVGAAIYFYLKLVYPENFM